MPIRARCTKFEIAGMPVFKKRAACPTCPYVVRTDHDADEVFDSWTERKRFHNPRSNGGGDKQYLGNSAVVTSQKPTG